MPLRVFAQSLRPIVAGGIVLAAGIGIGAAIAQVKPGGTATQVSVVGIENTTRQLQQMKESRNANQALAVVAVLQLLGKKQAANNGLSRLEYVVEVSPDGKVMVNGLDVSAIAALANKTKN